MSDLNRVILTGTIQAPRIAWLESGKPELRLSLTVEQDSPFKLYVQIYCYGKDCEPLAETLQAGDRVFIGDGRLSWRSTTKDGVKESKMVVTCFAVERLTTGVVAARSEGDATPEPSIEPASAPEPTPRRPRYPKYRAEPASSN